MSLSNSNSFKNSFLLKSSKGSSTAKSSLEKIKSLGSRLSNKTTESLGDISDTISSETSNLGSVSNDHSSIWTVIRYLLVFIVLGFILLNILAAFNLLPANLEKFFKPVLGFFKHTLQKIVKPNTTIDSSGNSISSTNDVSGNAITPPTPTPTTSTPDSEENKIKSDVQTMEQDIEKNLHQVDAKTQQNIDKLFNSPDRNQMGPQPDESGSATQSSQNSSKSGYCYIGEDRGFRSCIKVGVTDTCMSGDIFPTQEICINPNLRS